LTNRFSGRDVADTVGKIFLRLILMVVVPLVVSALALGVIGIGDLRQLGRIGLRTLVLTAAMSTIAVCLGVGLVNLFRPGMALESEQREF
jgi:DAACS family dicarboxylate/amino acid:cation (Na+ or H+) symporter